MSVRRHRYSIVGTRSPADEGFNCATCGSGGAPALILMRHPGGADPEPVVRLCLPCIGRAVEDATKWKVMNAWSQWLSNSRASYELRAKSREHGQ